MKFPAQEMFSEFSIRRYWWLPQSPQEAVFGTLWYSTDRTKLRVERSFSRELNTAYSPRENTGDLGAC